MIRFIRKLSKFLLKLQPSKLINDKDLESIIWVSNLYLKIKNVPGHIAEIGVADGRNAILFGNLIKMHNDASVRQYVGFDTFDGFNKRDLDRDNHLSGEKWKNISKLDVIKRCEDNNIEDLIELFEGDATETVPSILKNHKGKKFQPGKGKFALVYIDCNAYFPSIKSLENFLPYVVPG